jgi:hypothetical protein
MWAAELRCLFGLFSLVANEVAARGELTAVTAVFPTLWPGLAGKLLAVPRTSLNLRS